MALGCGIGVRKMARISSRVTESELEHAVNWRFSLDNIRAANDAVVKAMDEMDLPNIYRNEPGMLHTASDGQKFEVRGESLTASRSFKYSGQGQGVSAYSFVDERHILWHSLMISAADRESAYVIDGLMCNDVVQSDIHSTDSHGYTEAIFGMTHLLGFSFAPRIKSIGKQILYIFKPKNQSRDDWAIKPDKTINEALICENWDDLLRLIATIKLKENTASDIFRRLNSYSRQHALYQTLKAFGQIIKSLFILRYVDDLALRQAIERQLNKVELANRFTRAVAVGNPREFTQAEKEEQEVAEALQPADQEQHNLLELPLPRPPTRKGTGCRDQGTTVSSDRSTRAHGMGSHQHAGRVRLLRRKTQGYPWDPPPEISCLTNRPDQGEPKAKKTQQIKCSRKSLWDPVYLYADGPKLAATRIWLRRRYASLSSGGGSERRGIGLMTAFAPTPAR